MAFHIKIYVHRSRGIVEPSYCIQNHGYIDLINPLDGPSRIVHNITSRLGLMRTTSLRDMFEPDTDLLEAVFGQWFHESQLEACTVECELQSGFFPWVYLRSYPTFPGQHSEVGPFISPIPKL